ncbi:MAG: hypothetical protein NTU98_10090 [Bacteroidetes bacterium]|nr:hypothetical protein [Bacteroidota bacterium]
MKTIAKIIALISIMMLPIIANARIPAVVTYKVTVHMPESFKFIPNTIVVAITDANNNPVDHPQLLNQDGSIYVFTEPTSAKGIRIAQLLSIGNYAPLKSVAAPVVQKGIFFAGNTYYFDIWIMDDTGEVKTVTDLTGAVPVE